nr:WYL domain-containing protein [Tsukamurella asaccharolytica]
MRLVPLGRRWYLVAYDLYRHDWRSFRLDRISGPSRTGVRFRPRELPAEDAAAYVRASVGQRTPSHRIQFRVHAPIDHVRSLIGRWARLEETTDGIVVRMEADTLDWPAMAIAVLDAEVTVVEPAELTAHLARWAGNLSRARS